MPHSPADECGTATSDICNSYMPMMDLDMNMNCDLPGKSGGIVKNHSLVKTEITTTYEPK